MPYNVHDVKRGNTTRKSFSKIEEILDLPYFIELQKESYDQLIKTGIAELLRDFSPVTDIGGSNKVYLENPHLDGEPKYSIKACKERDMTYSRPLKIRVRLERANGSIAESDVFMGDLPIMTDSGSFIINGGEKVVVSQLAKSPGVFCEKVLGNNGVQIYDSKIQPTRGTWLGFEQDRNGNDILYVKVDGRKKVTVTSFLRALGVGENGTDEELLEIFNNNEIIKKTIEKDTCHDRASAVVEVYKKIKPLVDIPNNDEKIKYLHSMFYGTLKYDLALVGRYKVNKKLSIAQRIYGPEIKIARDIECIDRKTGELKVLAKKGDVLNEEQAIAIERAGVNEVFIFKNLDDKVVEVKVIGNNTVDLRSFVDLTDEEYRELGIDEKVYYPVLESILETAKNKEEIISLLKHHHEVERDLVTRCLTVDDLIATVNYNVELANKVGIVDITDHLGNKRIRSVGELLQVQLRKNIDKLSKFIVDKLNALSDEDEVQAQSLINVKAITSGIREFFNTSQLSQTMDHINPISALTHKRKLSALGPGGLTKERAGFSVRDIDYTHYGRMCPIETPEGQNIGLITSLALYARVNKYGFLETPFRKVDKKTQIVTKEIVYLDADDEDRYVVAQANEAIDENNKLVNERVKCRYRDQIKEFNAKEVDYMDVSPKQLISVATSLIPFLEHDDTTRALMGSNMQRQAVPLLKTEQPIVATGIEHKIAVDSGITVIARKDGVVSFVDAQTIITEDGSGLKERYTLRKFERTNASTCINQKPLVKTGDVVKAGEVIADGYATKNGELALGKNILVAFMEWEGYNYEDAVLISEDLVKDDVFTSIHINKYEVSARETQLGPESITRDIPGVSQDALKFLDDDGIIMVGAEVQADDILVGKITPKGESELPPEEKAIRSILGDKAKDVKNTSLRMPHGEYGVVVDVQIFSKENKDELDTGVLKTVKIYVAQKRKISVGDKMAGRHGNKGVVSRVLPREDMPYMADGTPIQILLNPLGVPSRMNVGQVLEVHLGLAAKALNWKVETPVFDGADDKVIKELFKQAGFKEDECDGKMQLYDGRTGEPFENRVTVGYMYYLKLDHLVDDKIHARSTGSYSIITKQPLGGKAQFGGQRFGEMEVWALEAYGAAHILQEMLTIKSDDVDGRNKAMQAILNNRNVSEIGVPEAFKVLIKEFQSLGLDVKALTAEDQEVQIDENDVDEDKFVTKIIDDSDLTQVDIMPGIELGGDKSKEFDFSSVETAADGFTDVEDNDFDSLFNLDIEEDNNNDNE